MNDQDVKVGNNYHVKYFCPIHGFEESDVEISGPIADGLFPAKDLESGGDVWVDASDLTPLPQVPVTN